MAASRRSDGDLSSVDARVVARRRGEHVTISLEVDIDRRRQTDDQTIARSGTTLPLHFFIEILERCQCRKIFLYLG
jgi:hypothetical protein